MGLQDEAAKYYQVKYQVNILPSVSDKYGDLLDALFDAGDKQLEIFRSESVIDYLEYKWDAFAFKQQMIGLGFHLLYCVILIIYIDHTFLKLEAGFNALGEPVNPESDAVFLSIIISALIYPAFSWQR